MGTDLLPYNISRRYTQQSREPKVQELLSGTSMKSAPTTVPLTARAEDSRVRETASTTDSAKTSESRDPSTRQERAPEPVEALLRRHAWIVHEIE